MLFSILLTEYSVMFPAEQLFFLFIALRLMQNPIGWCCDWLKIPELARGILSQSQYQWLVRAILHQAQGVFPVFVFLAKTRVSWCPIIYKVFSFRWVTRPQATCGTSPCNHLNSYLKWKKCRVENKYLLTFRNPVSSIRAPTWPEKFPQKPVEISLRHINFSICFVKQWFFRPFSHKKRGENPLSMGSLLFASTKIIHFSAKCKSI